MDAVIGHDEGGGLFDDEDRPVLPPWVRGAPETSREAAMSMLGCFSEIAQRVGRFISERGEHGATCQEVEEALGLSHQTASARLWELSGKNRADQRPPAICDSGQRRRNASGRKATVYVSTRLGAGVTA